MGDADGGVPAGSAGLRAQADEPGRSTDPRVSPDRTLGRLAPIQREALIHELTKEEEE